MKFQFKINRKGVFMNEAVKAPYALSDLGQKVKDECAKHGLELAEQAVEQLAKSVYVATKAWLKESALASENKIDDVVVPFLDLIDSFVLPQIEKIDLDSSGS